MIEWANIKEDYEEIDELSIPDTAKATLFQIVMAMKHKAEELLEQGKKETKNQNENNCSER